MFKFDDAFGEASVAVVEPAHPQKWRVAGTPRAASCATQSRAAVVAGMCADPFAVKSFGSLLTLPTADCLRQCLSLLPPGAGELAGATLVCALGSDARCSGCCG